MDNTDFLIQDKLIRMQLTDLRKAKHLTQKDVSDKTGLSLQCISDIENANGGNPTLKSLIKYLECLGLEICFQQKTF